jgi:SAM-dependent methyltransferase
MRDAEFDEYEASYERLLQDPLRDFFSRDASRFFHERKRDLIRAYFRQRNINTHSMAYLDLGCGKGDLLSLLRDDFSRLAGCDPAPGMLRTIRGVETRVQTDGEEIPFGNAEFDFVTAVCAYHHVPPAARLRLTREVSRVLKPGGIFALIEHNPYNPATRLIVSRTPVDANAILLTRREASRHLCRAGFSPQMSRYFLYFPEFVYRYTGDAVEKWLGKVPLGGQYAVFATKNVTRPGGSNGSNHPALPGQDVVPCGHFHAAWPDKGLRDTESRD